MEEAEARGGPGRRRRRSGGRSSSERSPSPGRLDVSSPRFDPLLALYSERTPLPYPAAPCFNNLAEYESFQRGLLRGPGRQRGSAARSSRSAGTRTRSRGSRAPADPERIQRLRSLMVAKEPGREADEKARARGRKAPRNVLTRMPRKPGEGEGAELRSRREALPAVLGIKACGFSPSVRLWVGWETLYMLRGTPVFKNYFYSKSIRRCFPQSSPGCVDGICACIPRVLQRVLYVRLTTCALCVHQGVHEGSPLGELHRCVREGVKVNVHVRTFKGLRGVCTGFLVAFDKFWNMALTDVDETYRKPVLGKAFYVEPQLTLTRLFDRLKLQESSVRKGTDSKVATDLLSLPYDPRTLGRKSESGRGRSADQRGAKKHSSKERTRSASLPRASGKEVDLPGRVSQTGGLGTGGPRGRSRKKRRPKVDYQQVFTRHINQIFIRGENVLLVHLAH
ncbi:hypothetical protein lerEdw1_016178 [Lerista edwardsae]|nr:hypothetical protein lerEdw1_016178 [Lerista edwardsae]